MKSFFLRLGVYLQHKPVWLLLPIYLVWFGISKLFNLHGISFQVEEKRFPGEGLVDWTIKLILYSIILINDLIIFQLLRYLISTIQSIWIFIFIHFLFMLFIPDIVFVPILMSIVVNSILSVLILPKNSKNKFKIINSNIRTIVVIAILLISIYSSHTPLNEADYFSKLIAISSFAILSTLIIFAKVIFRRILKQNSLDNSKVLKLILIVFLNSVLTILMFRLNILIALLVSFYITLTIQFFYFNRNTKIIWW